MRCVLAVLYAAGSLAASTVTAVVQSIAPDSTWHIEVDGARLFIRSIGSGPPIVVVHGGPGMSHDYLAPQLIELLADEYRLVSYDQRASGRSSGVEDTARITMAQFVKDLESLRRELALDQLNVLGNSFGGLLSGSISAGWQTLL